MGGDGGPVALAVFKTVCVAPLGVMGGFDSHSPPPSPWENVMSKKA